MPLDDTDAAPNAAEDDIRSALMGAIADSDAASTTETETKPEAADKTRAPDGKFAKAEAEAIEPDKAEPVKQEDAPSPEEKKTVSAAEPPQNWSEADKAAFKGLPADAQGFLLKRHSAMEADYTRKTQQIAQFRNEYEPVAEIFRPHADAMKQSGYTPASLVAAWANVEKELQAGRGIAVVKQLVDGYKLDRAQLTAALGLTAPVAAAGTTEPPAPAGQTAQLPPELAQKLQSYDQFIAQQQREQQQAAAQRQRDAESRVMDTIEQFKGAVDGSGAPLHPLYDEVEEHMTRLAIAARTRGEAVPSLDDLYDQAVWANPSTRQKVLDAKSAADEAQRVAAETKRAKEARAKAEQARRAGSSVTGSPRSGQSGQADSGSLRGSLLAAVADLDG